MANSQTPRLGTQHAQSCTNSSKNQTSLTLMTIHHQVNQLHAESNSRFKWGRVKVGCEYIMKQHYHKILRRDRELQLQNICKRRNKNENHSSRLLRTKKKKGSQNRQRESSVSAQTAPTNSF